MRDSIYKGTLLEKFGEVVAVSFEALNTPHFQLHPTLTHLVENAGPTLQDMRTKTLTEVPPLQWSRTLKESLRGFSLPGENFTMLPGRRNRPNN